VRGTQQNVRCTQLFAIFLTKKRHFFIIFYKKHLKNAIFHKIVRLTQHLLESIDKSRKNEF
jgi:hypothetical protein